MIWTERMSQVADIDAAWAVDHEQPLSYAKVGRQLGISGTRVRQIRLMIEAWGQIPRVSEEMHRKRAGAGYLLGVLRRIERDAKAAGKKYRPPKPKPDRWNRYPPSYMAYMTKLFRPLTQEQLQEQARHAHWADVVWSMGSDKILHVYTRDRL